MDRAWRPLCTCSVWCQDPRRLSPCCEVHWPCPCWGCVQRPDPQTVLRTSTPPLERGGGDSINIRRVIQPQTWWPLWATR